MADTLIPFYERLRRLVEERGVSHQQFERDTGIARRIFYKQEKRRKMCRSTIMACAYYFDMSVEELIAGTTAENYWYGEG